MHRSSRRRRGALAILGLALAIVACGRATDRDAPLRPARADGTEIPRCAGEAARPQSEMDHAGPSPIQPTSGLIRCQLLAIRHPESYSAAYELADAQVVNLYVRAGAPNKGGAVPADTTGTRAIGGTEWQWATRSLPPYLGRQDDVLFSLTGTIEGFWTQLHMSTARRDGIEALTVIAASLMPRGGASLEMRARCDVPVFDMARQYGQAKVKILGVMETTAEAMAKWEETPRYPGGPYDPRSRFRALPADATLALCFYELPPEAATYSRPSGAPDPTGPIRSFMAIPASGTPILISIGPNVPIAGPPRKPFETDR